MINVNRIINKHNFIFEYNNRSSGIIIFCVKIKKTNLTRRIYIFNNVSLYDDIHIIGKGTEGEMIMHVNKEFKFINYYESKTT